MREIKTLPPTAGTMMLQSGKKAGLATEITAMRATAPATAVKTAPGPPATLGSTAAAQARLIVWCRECRHQIEPDPAAMAERYGALQPSRPKPRGGSMLSRSDRSRSQIERKASAVALPSRLGGRVSSQSRYSVCRVTSSATASRHLCGRLRRSPGHRYLTLGAPSACAASNKCLPVML
jgi:hypothetical protein